MADEVITAEEQPIVVEPTAEQVQWKQNMDAQFDDFVPPAAVPIAEAAPEIITEKPIVTDIPTSVDYLKELGFESIDNAKAEIEALRKIKETTITPQEIEFANEESKKIHQLLKEGKTKEVKQYLDAQEMLSNVETMSNEQKLKLFIKMQNPRFDQELIDDEYQSLYRIDEDDFMDDTLKLRKEKLKLEQRIENDVAKAADYFAQYSKKVELPDITTQTIAIDESYESWKASNASVSDFQEKVIVPSVNAITEEKVKMAIEINDANNQMQFGVSIIPDKADLDAAKVSVIDFNDFLRENFYKDGQFLPEEATKFVLRSKNFDKYAQSIARQAVNAERKRMVETDKGTGGVQRDGGIQVELSELQKQMNYALS